jgi:hypothetical protein
MQTAKAKCFFGERIRCAAKKNSKKQEVTTSALCECGSGAARGRSLRGPSLWGCFLPQNTRTQISVG